MTPPPVAFEFPPLPFENEARSRERVAPKQRERGLTGGPVGEGSPAQPAPHMYVDQSPRPA